MNKKYYILLTIFILFNAGCIDTIDFDLTNADSQIVVYTEIRPNKTFQVKVSTSAVINTEQVIRYPDHALVSVKRGDVVLDDNFSFRSRDMCYLGIEAEEGIVYTLLVSIPNWGVIPVNSTTEIPVSQKFDEKLLEGHVIEMVADTSRMHYFEIEFTIDQSIEGGTNFFQVIPQRRRVEYDPFSGEKTFLNEYQPLPILNFEAEGDVATIFDHKDGLFIDGSSFQSGVVKLILETDRPLINGVDVFDHVYLTLNTLTPETYQYNQIKASQLGSQDSPLHEPIISYTNINYGIGLFGAYNSMMDSIAIQ